MNEFREGRRSPSRRSPSNSSGRGSGARPCAAAGEPERSPPHSRPCPRPPAGKEKNRHPPTHTHPPAPKAGWGGGGGETDGAAPRPGPPLPKTPAAAWLRLPPLAGCRPGTGERRKDGKKRPGPLPQGSPPTPLSAKAAAPHTRPRCEQGRPAAGQGAEGKEGEGVGEPTGVGFCPGQWVWLSSD